MGLDPREAVATTNRILYMENMIGPSGHVSVRNTATKDTAFANPHGASRGEITPEMVVEIDFENSPIDPDERVVGEWEIHTALYRAREEINAVLHLHAPYSTLFSISGTDLVPVHIHGSVLDGPVPVLDRPYLFRDRSDSDPMLEVMDGANQVLIRGHGSVVCDTDIKSALARAMYLERNARFQYHAAALGPPNQFSRDEVEYIRRQNWVESSIEKRWHFYT